MLINITVTSSLTTASLDRNTDRIWNFQFGGHLKVYLENL